MPRRGPLVDFGRWLSRGGLQAHTGGLPAQAVAVTPIRFLLAKPALCAALLALAVSAPGLRAGYLIDDWAHMAAISGQVPHHPGVLGLYDFGDGDPVRMRAHQDLGYPWFSDPELKVRFLRPLSCAMTYLDHTLFANLPAAAHALSMLLYALLAAGVAVLATATLGRGLGALAAVLYAVDDAHMLPAVWLANRNAVLAATPAVWATVAWLRWREQGWQAGRWWAVAGFAVGLCAGETALSALALPIAYELLGRHGQERVAKRVAALWPLLALFVGYAATYKMLGYGARYSGAYIDPIGETGSYLRAAALRIPGLVGVLTLNSPVEISAGLPGSMAPLAAAGVAGAALLAWLLRAAWPAIDADARRHLPWLVAGSLAALVPVAATFPAGRLLSVASIGGACVLACAIGPLLPRFAGALQLPAPASSAAQRVAARLLAAVHLLLAPIAFVGAGTLIGVLSRSLATADVDGALSKAAGKTAILPAAPDILSIYGALWRSARGLPPPARWRALSMALFDVDIRADDDHTLRLRVIDGAMLATEAEQLVRSGARMLRVGDRLDVNGMQTTVQACNAGGFPTEFTFHFDEPLRHPDHVWLQWRGHQLRDLPLPANGVWLRLKREPGLTGI